MEIASNIADTNPQPDAEAYEVPAVLKPGALDCPLDVCKHDLDQLGNVEQIAVAFVLANALVQAWRPGESCHSGRTDELVAALGMVIATQYGYVGDLYDIVDGVGGPHHRVHGAVIAENPDYGGDRDYHDHSTIVLRSSVPVTALMAALGGAGGQLEIRECVVAGTHANDDDLVVPGLLESLQEWVESELGDFNWGDENDEDPRPEEWHLEARHREVLGLIGQAKYQLKEAKTMKRAQAVVS